MDVNSEASFEQPASRAAFLKELFGIYRPVETLSEDENKSVILAQHKELKKSVVIRSDGKHRPIYELLAAVRHPNLPEICDVYYFDDGEIVIREYVRGISLAQALQTGLFKYAGAKKIIGQLCAALSFLHQNGWVHRDIKPENVLISDDGVAMLIDFDAARRFDGCKSGDTEALGTVGYAPPEQFGISQSDFRSDIYALGVLLNVMLTGTHPSDRLADGKAAKIVRRCTQINPSARFQTVGELQKKL